MTATTTINGRSTLDYARCYTAAGLVVLPIRRDGSKAPWGNEWQHRGLLTEAELQDLFGRREPFGMGILCGVPSGNVEEIDFDCALLFPPWCELVEAQAPGLIARLSVGETPRPGFRVAYRVAGLAIPGNTKLAVSEDKETLIETRGAGGQFLAPGCPECCHPSGKPYLHHSGPPLWEIPTITVEEREILISSARSFDRSKKQPPHAKADLNGSHTVGDDYGLRGPDWAEILPGWTLLFQRGEVGYWRRPGKTSGGCSATTGHCRGEAGEPLLHVFSSNAPLEPGTYGKFRAYALLRHAGDFKSAVKGLVAEGYGNQSQPGRNGHHARATGVDGDDDEVNEALDDPHRLARLFLADYRRDDVPRLRHWCDEWMYWNAGAWQAVALKDLKGELCERIKVEFDRANKAAIRLWQETGGADKNDKAVPKPEARKVRSATINDTVQALSGMTLLSSTTESPSWLRDAPEKLSELDALALLVCRNGIVHLPAAAADGVIYQHTPHLFTRNALTYDFDAAAGDPKLWLQFLFELFGLDTDAVGTLQEWAGYLLTPDTRLQKILMIVGPKRSGKGTIVRVLQALIGAGNCCAPTLASLTSNFGLWPLLGKAAAFIADAKLSRRTDAAVVVERLLSISGEDPQTVDRKNMSLVTTKLTTRFTIMTNELPKLSDTSGALAGRLIVLRLTKSFFGKEDSKLTEKLLAELPQILAWAIEGWRRLQKRGHFVQPESGGDLVGEMEDLASPVGAFVRAKCCVGPEHSVLVDDLFSVWESWCKAQGRKEAGRVDAFGRDLRAVVASLNVSQPRQPDGTRPRLYTGIGLLP